MRGYYVPKLSHLLFFILYTSNISDCRKHQLNIQYDTRPFFTMSSFGFLPGGELQVEARAIQVMSATPLKTFGFSLGRTVNDATNPYLTGVLSHCLLDRTITPMKTDSDVIVLAADLKNHRFRVGCSEGVSAIRIRPRTPDLTNHSSVLPDSSAAADVTNVKDEAILQSLSGKELCKKFSTIPLYVSHHDGVTTYSSHFTVSIINETGQGLYSLAFHNCVNYGNTKVDVNITVAMVERNEDSYLSAGEMWLPSLYFLMSFVFLVSSSVWLTVIRSSTRSNVFRTHYMMAALGFIKALSLLFHGINFHVIEENGYHIETWAVLYYITHLMKGALLFITILLLGTGWTFIKHVLSDREKKVFMIVVPLQLLANVARIILEESEEGDSDHSKWREILYMMDFLCCCFILVPVIWSIRHLQEASKTDGKADMNLRKLQLFRHFYVMIVCYIYFTRIIVFLLQIMVPFQYEWVDEMFREMVTFLFLAVTAIKFRPADNNPYFQVPVYDDESTEDRVLTDCESAEGGCRLRGHVGPTSPEERVAMLTATTESIQ